MISDRNRTWSRSRDGKASMLSWTKSLNGRRLHWSILGTSAFSILRFYIRWWWFFSLIVLSFRRSVEARERRSNFETFVAVFFFYEQRARIRATWNKVFAYSLFIGFSKNMMMILMMMKMIGVNRPKQRGARGSRRKKKKKLPSFFLLFSSFLETTFRLIINRQTQSSEEKRRSFSFAKFLSLSLSLFLSRRARESQHALTTLILFS